MPGARPTPSGCIACAGLLAASLACSAPAAPPPSTGPFTDVTVAFGLDAPHAAAPAFVGEPCVLVRFMTGGAAVGDVNGDGWPDIVLPRLGLPDRLLINDGGRGFVDRAEDWGVASSEDGGGALLFDADGDGDRELLVTSPTVAPRFYEHRGDRFELASDRGLEVMDAPAGDCTRMFEARAADVDGDGDLDVMTAAWDASDRSRLFENDGAGRFSDVTTRAGLDLSETALLIPALTDLDRDGDVDLLAIADFDHSRVFEGDGRGHFRDVTATSTLARIHDGMGFDTGDVDGDGHLDLFVSGICLPREGGCRASLGWTGNHLFFGDGQGGFRDGTQAAGVRASGWAWGATFFDADLDGDLDLAVTSGYGAFLEFEDAPLYVFENDGRGRFTRAEERWGLEARGQGRSVIAFDMDLDGDEDLLVVRHGAAPVLFRNDGSTR